MVSKGLNRLNKRIQLQIPEPRFTRPRNLKLFDWTNRNAPGKRVLNLGSGIGQFDHFLSKEVKLINLGICPHKKNLHVIADAHFLPFKSNSLGVRRAWIVADETFRVLNAGGHIVLELPFLNVIDAENDYFRFTDKGIRSLFHSNWFEEVFIQVGSVGGAFLSVSLLEYFQQFVPAKYLKALWQLIGGYLFSLFKYLDVTIDSLKDLRRTANSF